MMGSQEATFKPGVNGRAIPRQGGGSVNPSIREFT
jgi:hypothetical protein